MIKSFLIFLIRGYQFLKPTRLALYSSFGIVPTSCKYSPSCSQYTLKKINQYGTIKGLWLGLKRLRTCH